MKIAIITLPFNFNYGGILQAFALQKTLWKLGYEVKFVNRYSKGTGMPLSRKILSFSNRFFKRYFLGKQIPLRIWPNEKEIKYMAQNTDKFIRENISLTHFLKNESEFSSLRKYEFDAFIVGSDQVWRPKYSPKIENHFLAFLKNNNSVKRIAYAASFGVDKWEYTPKQTLQCSELAKKFHAVSVREEAAIKLCKKYLEIDAKQVIDPTMLLQKDAYEQLVEKDKLSKRNQSLLTYILDITPEIDAFIKKIETTLRLKSFSTMPENVFRFVGKKNIDSCIYPPVNQWIKGFMDAEFIVTDSFHGTIFSIIFNKPFFTIGNSKRGMSRFTSLLKALELEDRLLTENDNNLEEKLKSEIDYKKVNKILEDKKQEAISFLREALG